jgi:predicted NBD/HSP70 family sugar kinase
MDIGGTNLRIATANNKEIISIEEMKTEMLREKLNELKLKKFDRAVIAFAGQIDKNRKIALAGPNNKIRNLNFKQIAKEVILVRDTTAQLVAESLNLKAKNIVFLTLSTGVGMSAKINGKILEGKNGNFGEIGHTVINFDDHLPCTCERYNHIEAYIGGKALSEIASKKRKDIDYLLDHLFEFKEGKLIFEAYVSLFENIINLTDPEVIIVGGPAFLKHRKLFKKVIAEVRKRVIVKMPKILPAKLLNNGIIGAWLIAKNPTILS